MPSKMKNRYGDEYSFSPVNENTYTIVGDLKYWRYGGREGQEKMDYTNLDFVDPSGGPFIQVGMKIEGRKIIRLSVKNDKILFEVE